MGIIKKMFSYAPRKRQEANNGIPVEMPIGYGRGSDLNARVAEMVRREISMYAEAQGQETFEEADDFDIPDDPIEFSSPYEEHFDHEENYIKLREQVAEAKKRKKAPPKEEKSSVTEKESE